jgi:hypothetical protein
VEENPKPHLRALMIASVLLGALGGCLGALFGALCTSYRGIFDLPESPVMNALIGAPILGTGAGFTVAILRPRRVECYGCFGWGVLLVTMGFASSVLAAPSFCLIGRFGRNLLLTF